MGTFYGRVVAQPEIGAKVKPRLYLKVGDVVRHSHHHAWGSGEVVEEKHSVLPGGICLVRIIFEDGIERSFINDLNHECCCYYAGLKTEF